MTQRDEAARHDTHPETRVSRRTLLKGGLALGRRCGTAGLAGLSSSAGASIDAGPRHGAAQRRPCRR